MISLIFYINKYASLYLYSDFCELRSVARRCPSVSLSTVRASTGRESHAGPHLTIHSRASWCSLGKSGVDKQYCQVVCSLVQYSKVLCNVMK